MLKKLMIFLFVVIMLTSCGTYKAITEKPDTLTFCPIYKGVAYDVVSIELFWGSPFAVVDVPLYVVDVPFSLVADTVVLPYYVYRIGK